MTLSYIADTPSEYKLALNAIATLQDLKVFGEHWNEMFSDAAVIIQNMNEVDFVEFQKGKKKERSGKFAGDAWNEKYGNILLPELMLRVGMIAVHFHAPFGTAWNRLEDMGYIKHNGVCYFLKDKSDTALEVDE